LVYPVTVIAFFVVGILGLQIRPQNPVTASSGGTGRQASIILPRVAIVAFLKALVVAVTTAGRSAIDAVVPRIVVTVITALTGTLDSITTASLLAVAETGIGIVSIAVIAGFIAGVVLR
tara:strand:- start:98 stop:454 length:357 start_codon:yes stop_codon:yes gene_type:complete